MPSEIIFHGVKRTSHAVKYTFHGVQHTFHGVKRNLERQWMILRKGIARTFNSLTCMCKNPMIVERMRNTLTILLALMIQMASVVRNIAKCGGDTKKSFL